MSKTKEELNKIKEDVEAVNEKLAELTPEEIAQVSGGVACSGLAVMRTLVPGADMKGLQQVSERPAL